MHSYIHYIIYKSQDRETIQVLVNREMDKDDVFYIYIHTHTHTMDYYSAITKE